MIKRLVVFVILGLLAGSAFAQSDSLIEKEEEFVLIETEPVFPGGPHAMNKYIVEHVVYPEIARESDIQGRVFVTFTVGKDGSISDVVVMRGVHPSLDQEAIRVIKSMPKWKPGTSKGKPVRVRFNLPINFKLS